MGTNKTTEHVNAALAAVDASEAKDEYKLAAFKIVLSDLLGHTTREYQATPSTGDEQKPGKDVVVGWQQKIATKFKITDEQVAALYHKEDDGALRLILDTSILPKNKQTATQDIAQLIVTARVAAGFDDASTEAEIIRNEAEYYGRLDTNNFSRALRSLKPNFHYDSKSKTLTPRAPGFADGAAIAKKYLGQEK